MVTVRAERRTIALLVDDVIGLVTFDAEELAGRPSLLTLSRAEHTASPVIHRRSQA
jgi:hypothetical protein